LSLALPPEGVDLADCGANSLARATANEFIDALRSSPIPVILAVPGQRIVF
jgi:hypothetical protein